jgi:TonB family protein
MKTDGWLGIGLSVLALCSLAAVADETDPTVIYMPGDAGARVPLHTLVPDYPELARRERVEGEVQVCFNVDREGRTHNVRVRRSTNRIFEKPALRAVRASTFAPLPAGEKPSGIKTCRTFRFSLSPVEIEDPD